MAFAAELDAPSRTDARAAPGIGKAKCPDCNATPKRKGRKTDHTARVEQCAQDAKVAVLLDWHTNAGSAYGFGSGGISCTAQPAQSMPIPIAESEAYEIIARFPGGRTPAASRQRGDKSNEDNAFPKAAY